MDPFLTVQAITHVVYGHLRWLTGLDHRSSEDGSAQRDRGAVSLEQVLWFVAAGVAVAGIAAVIWNKVRSAANSVKTK